MLFYFKKLILFNIMLTIKSKTKQKVLKSDIIINSRNPTIHKVENIMKKKKALEKYCKKKIFSTLLLMLNVDWLSERGTEGKSIEIEIIMKFCERGHGWLTWLSEQNHTARGKIIYKLRNTTFCHSVITSLITHSCRYLMSMTLFIYA